MWEHGRISVATEHLATAMTESLLNPQFTGTQAVAEYNAILGTNATAVSTCSVGPDPEYNAIFGTNATGVAWLGRYS